MKAERVEITLNGIPHTVERGTLISQVLTPSHGVSLVCGGKHLCRKCRVRAFGELSALTPEEAFFTEEERRAGYRLACCTAIEGPCRIQTDTAGRSRICAEGVMPDFQWDPLFTAYGAAIDIGTTTLALHLYDPHRLRAEITAPNPQAFFGGDVISRITRSLEGKGAELAACIRGALTKLLEEGADQAGIPVTAIDHIVITGNTTMLYLLTGRDVYCLSRAPFEADHLFGDTLSAGELDLPCPMASVYLTPCISAFVGGDITTALLAAGLQQSERIALLADIGTNGEIVLHHNGELLCCATAAGPAFEGAGLSMGMAGKAGAIDRLFIENGKLCFHVIDEIPPVGVCGSGIIDAIACLLETEQLDESGLLENDPTVLGGEVSLAGKDVRMIQLAKAAIRAGMETLLHHAQITADDLQELAIAGGFGSFIDIPNAMRIGLIPTVPTDRVRVLGNAALAGADMILLDKKAVKQAVAIAAHTRTVELSSDPVFQEQYMENMGFWND